MGNSKLQGLPELTNMETVIIYNLKGYPRSIFSETQSEKYSIGR